MHKKKGFLISLIILAGAAIVVVVIFLTEPTAERESAAKETAMLVNVTEVERGSYHPVFVSTGTVRPTREIVLSPQVSGEVMERSPDFNPGNNVEKGDKLLQLEPADYKNTLQLRKSELQEARASLQIEKGQQEVARRDYEQSGEEFSEENKALMLRIPQLNTARSNVESARAAVDQAELDLQRTTIRAPFQATILSRNVDVGSQVGPGDQLGRLVGIEKYWVEATVPQSRLRWLEFSNEGEDEGAQVHVRNRSWSDEENRTGQLYKMVGALEDDTRLVRVLVEVPDPLALNFEAGEKQPLMIGAFVEASIRGRELENVIKLNRDYVRKGNTVWVMKDGELDIRDVEIVLDDAEHAYISEGLENNDRVVTTNLATVVDGAPLRVDENGNR
ncbi:MAG: efflux RND transporter periplasmic adaptor subunit [Bacteroidota bacterium]